MNGKRNVNNYIYNCIVMLMAVSLTLTACGPLPESATAPVEKEAVVERPVVQARSSEEVAWDDACASLIADFGIDCEHYRNHSQVDPGDWYGSIARIADTSSGHATAVDQPAALDSGHSSGPSAVKRAVRPLNGITDPGLIAMWDICDDQQMDHACYVQAGMGKINESFDYIGKVVSQVEAGLHCAIFPKQYGLDSAAATYFVPDRNIMIAEIMIGDESFLLDARDPGIKCWAFDREDGILPQEFPSKPGDPIDRATAESILPAGEITGFEWDSVGDGYHKLICSGGEVCWVKAEHLFSREVPPPGAFIYCRGGCRDRDENQPLQDVHRRGWYLNGRQVAPPGDPEAPEYTPVYYEYGPPLHGWLVNDRGWSAIVDYSEHSQMSEPEVLTEEWPDFFHWFGTNGGKEYFLRNSPAASTLGGMDGYVQLEGEFWGWEVLQGYQCVSRQRTRVSGKGILRHRMWLMVEMCP